MRNPRPDFTTAGSSQLLLKLDFSDEFHRALLRQAYHGVYSAVFPKESERAPLDLWFDWGNPESQAPIKLTIILAVENMFSGNPDINGIAVGVYYTKSQSALIGYNGVGDHCQGKGLGFALQKALMEDFEKTCVERSEKLQGVFVEVNDPEKIGPDEDSFDPAARMAIYKRWGALIVPINYIQPALGNGADKFHGSKLMYYPVGEEHPSAEIVRDFLSQEYKNFGYDLAQDADFQSMMSELDNCHFSPISGCNPPDPHPGTIQHGSHEYK